MLYEREREMEMFFSQSLDLPLLLLTNLAEDMELHRSRDGRAGPRERCRLRREQCCVQCLVPATCPRPNIQITLDTLYRPTRRPP